MQSLVATPVEIADGRIRFGPLDDQRHLPALGQVGVKDLAAGFGESQFAMADGVIPADHLDAALASRGNLFFEQQLVSGRQFERGAKIVLAGRRLVAFHEHTIFDLPAGENAADLHTAPGITAEPLRHLRHESPDHLGVPLDL